MTNDRRVVVTGLGVVSSIGIGKEPFWSALLEGRSGIKKIQGFDVSSYPSQIGGEVLDLKLEKWIDPSLILRTAKATQFGLVATKMALEDAGLHPREIDPFRTAVIIGTGLGGMGVYENEIRTLIATGNPRRVHPLSIPLGISNAIAGEIAINICARGPNITLSTACSSGTHAIGYGFELLQQGKADVVIAGGAEACLLPGVLAGFCSLRTLSVRNNTPKEASCPFDKKRDGFVMGEGAGIVILETLSHTKIRKGFVYAEIVGYGSSCEATHMVRPELTGEEEARVMKMALQQGNLILSDVDYINSHGTSTVLNDLVETRAIKILFREYAHRISVNATKSMIGHTIGAAGAIEAIVCALTLQRKIIHPTINYEEPDTECDLDYTPNIARERKVKVALSNSFGFGSNNACLAILAFS